MERELTLILGRLDEFASRVKDGLHAADWSTPREIIRALVKRVEIDQEQVRVVLRVNRLLLPLRRRPQKKIPKVCNIVGGVSSPILANVFLHERDEYIEKMKKTYEKGARKRDNPEYVRLIREKNRLVAQGVTKTKAFRAIMKQIRAIASKLVNDPAFCRVKYLRYADDWLIGLCGSRATAEEVKELVKTFLHDHLKLILSERIMDFSGCGPDHPTLQQRQSWSSELLPLCR